MSNSNTKVLSLLFIFALYFIGSSTLHAQRLIVDKGTIKHEKQARECIQITMEPMPKEVKKAWDDYLQDNFDVNLKGIGFLSNKDMLSAEGVLIPDVSDKKINLYTQVVERGNLTEMCVFASMGGNNYLSQTSYPLEFNRLQNTVEAFIGNFLPEHYRELVEDTEKNLEDLMKRKKDLADDIAKNREDIAKMEKENREKSREIVEIEDEIESLGNILRLRQNKRLEIDRELSNRKFK